MYETITAFLPRLQEGPFGEWICDRENDGSPAHPKMMPCVEYAPVVSELAQALRDLRLAHRDWRLSAFGEILQASPVPVRSELFFTEYAAGFDGRTLLAWILSVYDAERFCTGALLGAWKDGSLARALELLRALDGIEENGAPG